MQASGLLLAWFSLVPRGAVIAMAMLAFLQSDPVVGAKWTDIQFKGAIDCLAANGLTMPEELANLQFGDLKDADGATALTKGVLRRALDRATVAAAKASAPGATGSAMTDALATEVQRAKSRGIARPFIYTELAKFKPLCARGAGGSPDDDEPESKEAAALARAFGRGTAAESQPLLAWTPWHQAYVAWSVAAAVTDQISYTSAMAHKHVVLQVALVYDRLVRRTWAERAAAGAAGFQAAAPRQ
ncbi:unnamed protein product, partial [Prorocentrum cordatum]